MCKTQPFRQRVTCTLYQRAVSHALSPRAVEAQALREELAAAREAARCDEAAALGAELEGLRAELLRLADENRRLQSTPKVRMRTVVQSASR